MFLLDKMVILTVLGCIPHLIGATLMNCNKRLDSSGGITVDCSHTGMSQLPNYLPSNTYKLLLNNNNFSRVPSSGDLSRYKELTYLDISYNNIQEYDSGAFKEMNNLQYLKLGGWHDCINETAVPNDVFDGLPNLKVLKFFASCSGKRRNQKYLDDALQKIQSISELHTTGTAQPLPNGFKNLENLEHLEFSGKSCHMGNLTEEMFQNVRNLPIHTLVFHRCGVYSFSAAVFKNFPKLKRFVHACDKISDLQVELNTLSATGLFFEYLALDRLKAQEGTSFLSLTSDIICTDSFSSLKTMSLRSNKIYQVDAKLIFCLPKLEYLSMSYNNIMNLNNSHLLQNSNHRSVISTLDITHHLGGIDNSFAKSYCRSDGIDFDSFLPKPQFPKAEDGCEGHNFTVKAQDDSHVTGKENVNTTFNFGPSVVNLYADSGLYFHVNKSLIDFCNLRYVNLSESLMRVMLFDLNKTYHKLEILDLSQGKLDDLPSTAFHSVPNLKELYLQENEFHDGKPEIKGLKQMEVLDISCNRIKSITNFHLQEKPLMRHLNLSNNFIKEIPLDALTSNYLYTLDASKNWIYEISDEFLNRIDELQSIHTNFTFGLHGNFLKCTCKQSYFLQWWISTKVHIPYKDTVKCELENSTMKILSSMNIPEFLGKCNPHLMKQDNKAYIGMMVGIIVPVIILFIIFIILVYCNRWNIVYWCSVLCEGTDKEQYRVSVAKYPFDVFIFDGNQNLDKDLQDWFCAKLEGEWNLKMCIPSRDLPHEFTDSERVTAAIQNSIKVIFLISSSTAKPYITDWLDFAVNISISSGGLKKIVIIMMEELPREVRFSRSLMTLLLMSSPINFYAKSAGGRNLFFEYLRRMVDFRYQRVHGLCDGMCKTLLCCTPCCPVGHTPRYVALKQQVARRVHQEEVDEEDSEEDDDLDHGANNDTQSLKV